LIRKNETTINGIWEIVDFNEIKRLKGQEKKDGLIILLTIIGGII
jgi:hypothetical protein